MGVLAEGGANQQLPTEGDGRDRLKYRCKSLFFSGIYSGLWGVLYNGQLLSNMLISFSKP